ncbi:hypothetical protein F971_01486, partial [Acinetobacter vivianii]
NITIPAITVDAKGLLKVVSNHTIRSATTGQTGVVQLNDTVTSNSQTQAATANAVNTLNEQKVDKVTRIGSVVKYRDLASFYVGSLTGAIIIKPPARLAKSATTMLRLSVEGYNYANNSSWIAELAGYHYSPSKNWLNTSASVTGRAPFDTVRFARNSNDELHIILGDEKTRWAYPTIWLRELIASFNHVAVWADDWKIESATDLTGYTIIATPEVLGTGLVDSAKKLAQPFKINGVDCDGTSDVVVTTAPALGVNNKDSTTGLGLSLYNGASTGLPSYGMAFAGTNTFERHGQVTGDWATYLTMAGDQKRGWIFKHGTAGNVASINGFGDITGRDFYGNLKGRADEAVQFVSVDQRLLKPKDIDKGRAQLYFTSEGGLNTDKINSRYGDFLVLNSYRDKTGGDVNGLFFTKNYKQGLFHFRGPIDADSWANAKEIAYIDSDSTGNSATATRLQTARTVSFSGAATGSFSYNGSANSSCVLALANSGVVAGSYGNNITIPAITVDAKGLLKVVSNHTIRSATTGQTGVVQLNDTLTSNSQTQAATANVVKQLNENKINHGDYGLGKTITLPNNMNFSDIKEENSFWMKGSSPPADSPFPSASKVVNLGNVAWNTQLGFAAYENRMAIRSRTGINAAFRSWREFAFTDSNISGNSATATRLQTVRKINGVDFNGTRDISLEAPLRYGGNITNLAQVDKALEDGKYSVVEVAIAGLYAYGVLHVYRVGGITHQTYYPHVSSGANDIVMAVRQAWNTNGDVASFGEWKLVGTRDDSKFLATGSTSSLKEDVAWNAKSGVYTKLEANASRLITQFLGYGSTGALQLQALYGNGGLYYRSARDTFGFEKDWERLVTETSGNAPTASRLQTPRNIGIRGAVHGDVNFDGSGNVELWVGLTQALQPKDVTGSRAPNTTYVNPHDVPMTVTVAARMWSYESARAAVSGVLVGEMYADVGKGGSVTSSITFEVGPKREYRFNGNNIVRWTETV